MELRSDDSSKGVGTTSGVCVFLFSVVRLTLYYAELLIVCVQAGDSSALLTDEYKMVSVLTCEFCDLPVLTVASKSNTVS